MGNVNAISNDKVLATAFGLSGVPTNTGCKLPQVKKATVLPIPSCGSAPRRTLIHHPLLPSFLQDKGGFRSQKGLCYHNHVHVKCKVIL